MQIKSKKNISFDDIAKDIINTEKFNELKSESHHGITRFLHVMRVSKYTYKSTDICPNPKYLQSIFIISYFNYDNNDNNHNNRHAGYSKQT